MEEQAPTTATENQKSPRRISNKVLISLIVVAAVLVSALGAFAYRNFNSTKNVELASATATESPAVSLAVKTVVSERIVDEGVTWSKPSKLDDLGLFEKSGENSAYSSTDYYKVGSTSSGGEIILAKVNIDEPGQTDNIQRIIKNGDSYKRISQNSEPIDGNSFTSTSKLENDSSFVFKSLLADKVVTKDDTELISSQSARFITEENTKSETKKVASTKWGDLYLEKTNTYSVHDINQSQSDTTGIVRIARYYISLNDSSQMTYEPRPTFLRDDNTFNLTFTLKPAAANKYEKFETGGCGLGFGSFPFMIDSNSLEDKIVVASGSGSNLYTIGSEDNKTLLYAYELYKSDQGSGKKDLNTFKGDNAFVFWTDAYGSTIGFLNSEYKPNVECGKPVVYLYPQTETAFKVAVGAEVTKSEPIYAKGWSGIAKPGGELVVGGKSYPNLFWEGKGMGVYPKVDFGKIVKSSEVKSAISEDLAYMGLNAREIADFNAYWLEKIPQSKYIRLSWLTNAELDVLAPLYIQPKPDSTIRVFLDFAGYDNPISLMGQKLPKLERRGFTAVEWGGLLKGK